MPTTGDRPGDGPTTHPTDVPVQHDPPFVGPTMEDGSNADGGITIAEEDFEHVIDRHTEDGVYRDDDSFFYTNNPDVIRGLIIGAEDAYPRLQEEYGTYARIVYVGEDIGWTRTSGPTRTYTVVTDRDGNLVTAFPGVPKDWRY